MSTSHGAGMIHTGPQSRNEDNGTWEEHVAGPAANSLFPTSSHCMQLCWRQHSFHSQHGDEPAPETVDEYGSSE